MFVDIACRCWNDEIVSWGDSGIDFNESQYPKTNWQEKNYEANPMYAENNNANSLSATDVYQLTQLIGRFDVDAYANGKTRVANLYGKDLKFNVWVAPGSDPNV